MRFPYSALLIVLVSAALSSVAFAGGSDKPVVDLTLTSDLCELKSQQPNNNPPAGVDFLSGNEIVVYTVCHSEGALAERDKVLANETNHLRAVIVDIPSGTIKRRFDWNTRGRGSMLRVTHEGNLLLKLDNVIQVLKPDKTPVAGLKIPKVNPTDLVMAETSPAVDAVTVTLSSAAPGEKTVNGVAVLDTRTLKPISNWHEAGEWWNLAASTKSVVRTANEGASVELQPLEGLTDGSSKWAQVWNGAKIPSPPKFLSDAKVAFPALDGVYIFDLRENKTVEARCARIPDTSFRPAYFHSVRAARIATSRSGETFGTLCFARSGGYTPTGWIANASIFSGQPIRRSHVVPLDSTTFENSDFALSPDGSRMAFIDSLHLKVFDLQRGSLEEDEGTDKDQRQESNVAASKPVPKGVAKAEALTTFRTTSRLVTVDVVATDSKGEFVPGLKAEDFTIRENGRQQLISSFAEHVSTAANQAGATSQAGMPPANEYVNIATRNPATPVSIILFDLLNTGVLDRARGRQQMLKFLQSLPPGQSVALFVLGNDLRLVQGFSGDSSTLVAAGKEILTHGLQPMSAASDLDLQRAQVRADMESYRGNQTAQRIADALLSEGAAIQEMHTLTTVDAMKQLARAATGYPGRKNLFWLSAEFPLPVYETEYKSARSFPEKVHAVLQEMSAAQVAIYPINVLGLAGGTGIDITTPVGPAANLETERHTAAARQTMGQWDSQEQMENVAEETGGRAFYGTNDVSGAVGKALQHGSSYYALTYVPPKSDDGKFRKIDVKMARPGLNLSYRRGYYAVKRKELSVEESAQALAEAMYPAVPESTMLSLHARLAPADPSKKTVGIDFVLDPHEFRFEEQAGGVRRATLDLKAIAFDKEYRDTGHFSSVLDMSLPSREVERVLNDGVRAHVDLNLKPGKYTVRVGAMDRLGQKIGTVDVPVEVTAGQSSEAGTQK